MVNIKLGQNAGEVLQTITVVDWHCLDVKFDALDLRNFSDLPEAITTPDDASKAIAI